MQRVGASVPRVAPCPKNSRAAVVLNLARFSSLSGACTTLKLAAFAWAIHCLNLDSGQDAVPSSVTQLPTVNTQGTCATYGVAWMPLTGQYESLAVDSCTYRSPSGWRTATVVWPVVEP